MSKKPKHIAIIMDGNGRWATSLGKARHVGHQVGSKVIREIVECSVRLGIQELTVFGLSCDNMARPQEELHYLLSVFMRSLQEYTQEMHDMGVCLKVIGDVQGLGCELSKAVRDVEEVTKTNKVLTLTVALNFSGKWHIHHTTQKLLENPVSLSDDQIEQAFSQLLPSDPDILIRTGGERRLSNFVLYHLAYTELYFLDVKWPDFRQEHLESVLASYAKVERRFGNVGVSV